MAFLRGAWIGAWVALSTPFWVCSRPLGRLLALPDRPRAPSPDVAFSVRVSLVTLRRLARLPASPWRNTCLYRSVATCRCLRAHGLEARLRLGVRRDGTGSGIAAHAWVETAGAIVEESTPAAPRAAFALLDRQGKYT